MLLEQAVTSCCTGASWRVEEALYEAGITALFLLCAVHRVALKGVSSCTTEAGPGVAGVRVRLQMMFTVCCQKAKENSSVHLLCLLFSCS